MRVLGIDPGLTRCGVGIVDVTEGRVATLVHVTVIRTPAGHQHESRLLTISTELEALMDEYRPERVALERVFADTNVSTVMGTAQVSGLAMLAAAKRSLPIGMHTPTEVKAAVTGYGQADKKQVGTMVAKILRLAVIPKPADAADALALAICHAWRSPLGRLAGSATADLHGGAESRDRPDRALTGAQAVWFAAEQAAKAASPERRGLRR
ncbi:crossover junction endodeoxyribonuclease RuvC [Subtercola boreus]|uniref:Crossover junction endodeoxyribonuclease RuvC n=1 Tax=Subtercola boreus TaxID=120213 RepID=A0A3E0WB73_9MICO|nr:crossover junction endodeoxyribonuclease RuvC [Subtercola boreus]RFA21327.1 crossover junction endodeoxyribonuclease RuvC [Subtercola boreus]RFA21710.1 crossover junction endodeoxyribonuclease RuvC [Subtercola boreus]RFA27679.1 crossover junction endodeoxyribonuclease RuvC [Subtercola boreus]